MKKCIFISFLATAFSYTSSFAQRREQISAKFQAAQIATFSVDSSTTTTPKVDMDFYYHDVLGEGHPVAIFREGISLALADPTFFFQANDLQLPFLIYPGEKIHIKYADTDSVCFYIKNNETRNNELLFFRNMVLKTGNVYYGFKVMPYLKKVSTTDSVHLLEKRINQIKNERVSLLSESAIKFSKLFTQTVISTIESTAFIDSLILYYHNLNLLVNAGLYKNLILRKIQSFKKIGFIPFQPYFRACEAIVATAVAGNPNYSIHTENDVFNFFNFSRKELNGPAKDFMMYWVLASAYRNVIPVSKQLLNLFNAECTNDKYKSAIEEKKNQHATNFYRSSSDILKPMNNQKDTNIPEVIESNKGNLILLDFWASWCAPCRMEMPFEQKLKQKFKTKNVVFINISIDENEKDWLKASEQEGLQENNYLLMDPDNSGFLKKYTVLGIPRYFLLSKDGKVISHDAPRPSEESLEKLIRKNLMNVP